MTMSKVWSREHPWIASASGAAIAFVILTAYRLIALDEVPGEAVRESGSSMLIFFVIQGAILRYFPRRDA